jgi:hypothetical protein
MHLGGICDACSTCSERRQAVRSNAGDQTRTHEDTSAAAGTPAPTVDHFVAFSENHIVGGSLQTFSRYPSLDRYDNIELLFLGPLPIDQ